MGTYEKDKINIQAANRREEKRQAGCHTSKTGTQLQQTAEITEHGGKRNRRCERCSNKDTDTVRLKLFIAKAGQTVHAVRAYLCMNTSNFALKCHQQQRKHKKAVDEDEGCRAL